MHFFFFLFSFPKFRIIYVAYIVFLLVALSLGAFAFFLSVNIELSGTVESTLS